MVYNACKLFVFVKAMLNYVESNPYLYAMESVQPDPKILVEIVQTKMPFGKYKGTLISDLPVYYLSGCAIKGSRRGRWGCCYPAYMRLKLTG
jgi:uncharacterized protein (DUF3820 family)